MIPTEPLLSPWNRWEAVPPASSGDETLDELVAPGGPAAVAWLTRVTAELARLNPGRFLFRLDYSLNTLREWMRAAGVEPLEERLYPSLRFDSDRGVTRRYPESGHLVFDWNGARYRFLACRIWSVRLDETYTWGLCDSPAAAEALVEAVGRGAWRRKAGVEIFQDGDWEEAPRLEEDLRRYTWDSVVLPDETKTRIRQAAEHFFASGDTYGDLEIPWKLGFLLVGPPGTGKTLTTKVLAATSGLPFLYVRGFSGFEQGRPDLYGLREMFRGARDRAPCVLCLEDVDSLVTEDLRSAFLNEMDGLEERYHGLLTVATTNHPEKLDPALLHRPSRFDYRFEFPLPDETQRRAFVRHWVEKLAGKEFLENGPRSEAAVVEIARRSHGMSQAYLRRVMIGTALRMHLGRVRGDQAFHTLALEELADASGDRSTAHRVTTRGETAGQRVGFRLD